MIELKEGVTFEGVKFRYATSAPDQPDALQGVSFKVKAGQLTTIVGLPGSGKSTILQLIMRFYDVKQGKICFDGVPLTELSLGRVRQSISLISKECFFMEAPLKENFKILSPKATEEDMNAALNLAQVDFLENGIETEIESEKLADLSKC